MTTRLRCVILLVLCLLSVGILSFRPNDSPRPAIPPQSVASLPEPTPEFASRHRNTHGAERVGRDRCVDCHKAESAAFLSTPHARSLQRVQPNEEPPDAQFVHAASGQTYQVERKHGQLWHREGFVDGDGVQIAATEHPMTWRIGSGHHSRSYLFDVDGFLFESPITWYTSRRAWDMSPGFDVASHEGFARAAHDGCVQCHCGQIESIGSSTQRLNILEPSIGCEDCHGPGSLHVDERSAGLTVDTADDNTIVNPRKLSRQLNESICARCHLRGTAWSFVRGRDLSDFRPGLPLSDYRVDFIKERSSGSMEVVGHFEQMHASRCYTESETLTCTTCHNPHDSPAAENQLQHYRRACLQCHNADASECAVTEPQRRKQSPADDCVQCHMPKSDTDIPHFTFTHHRIGVHDSQQQQQQQQKRKVAHSSSLVPFGDVSRLAPLDLQRCRGVALARPNQDLGPLVRQQALRDLGAVHNQGLRDVSVLGGLAYALWNQNDPNCLQYAEQALAAPECEGEIRILALIVLGDMYLQRGEFGPAAAAFEQLTQLRPRYTDFQMLGVCRSLQKLSPQAVAAFEKAVELRPGSADIHSLLADELVKVGRTDRATQHRQLASRLRDAKPRPKEGR